MIYRTSRRSATQLVSAELGSVDLNELYARVRIAAKLCPADALMADSKPESATLRGQNMTLFRRLRHSISRLCRSPGLTVDFKKTSFAVAAVDALGDCIGAVFASQWKRYPVLA